MLTISKKPIRTCIACRKKQEQNVLLRFKSKNKKLQFFDKEGRSFYICMQCISFLEDEKENIKNIKKLEKALCKECKNKDDYIGQLKEILTHVR